MVRLRRMDATGHDWAVGSSPVGRGLFLSCPDHRPVGGCALPHCLKGMGGTPSSPRPLEGAFGAIPGPGAPSYQVTGSFWTP
jgi:hypothetical protein